MLSPPRPDSFVWFNSKLVPTQQETVTFALRRPDVGVVHGPPGTGKTTVLIEIALQLIARGEKVFLFAPSNTAVDNLFVGLLAMEGELRKRLAEMFPGRDRSEPIHFVRSGHLARMNAKIESYSLAAKICDKVTSEDLNLFAQFAQSRNPQGAGAGRRKTKSKDSEVIVKTQLNRLSDATVIAATLDNAASVLEKLTEEMLSDQMNDQEVISTANREYDLFGFFRSDVEGKPIITDRDVNGDPVYEFPNAIIDEVGQALEPQVWKILMNSKRTIIAGDHNQLEGTVINQEAQRQGLATSILMRVIEENPCRTKFHSIYRMLTVQFRMNQEIMAWPSLKFYQNELVAHESVQSQRLTSSMVGVLNPILWIDTLRRSIESDENGSKTNVYEQKIVVNYVEELIYRHNVSANSIGKFWNECKLS